MRVMRGGRSFTVDVAPDGVGLVSHAGAALLAEVADRTGLTRELSRALAGLRERRGRHDPGRVIRDLAVMLADGGDCLADLRAVADQGVLFGEVASTSITIRCGRAPKAQARSRACARAARSASSASGSLASRSMSRNAVESDATGPNSAC